jgi:hypothetical protein
MEDVASAHGMYNDGFGPHGASDMLSIVLQHSEGLDLIFVSSQFSGACMHSNMPIADSPDTVHKAAVPHRDMVRRMSIAVRQLNTYFLG